MACVVRSVCQLTNRSSWPLSSQTHIRPAAVQAQSGHTIGHPLYLIALLHGLLTLAALATTTIVLITQQRQARLESQRAHLDLQVNLLTEQIVTKVIHLLEELRRDLPMVRDRDDAEASGLQQRTDAAEVLSALEDVGVSGPGPASKAGDA